MKQSYGKQNNKTMWGYLAIGLFVLCLLSVPVSFAYFEKDTSIDTTFSFANADMTLTHDISAGDLKNPGDRKEISISFENTGNVPLRYYLTLERSALDSELASQLMVYWDDEYIGMLADLTTGQLGTFDEGGAIPLVFPETNGVDDPNAEIDLDLMPEISPEQSISHELDSSTTPLLDETRYFLTAGDTQEHVLALEYHIGARAINAINGRTASFTLSAYSENIRLYDETIVSNQYELEQAMLLASYGLLTQNKIILANNIALTKDLSLSDINKNVGAFYIDLNGNTLDLGTNSIAVSGETVLVIDDSQHKNRLRGGRIVLSGSDSYVAGDALDGYTGIFDTVGYTPTSEVVEALSEYFILPKAEKNLKNGIKAGTITEFIGGYCKYGSKLSMTFPSYITYMQADGTLTSSVMTNRQAKVTICGHELLFEVIGSAGADEILQIEKTYLSMLTGSDPIIYYDILLPTRFKEYNAHVEWWSSEPETLSSNGNYTSPWVDTEVTLLAKYTINDEIVVREYPITVKGYSYEDKMSYFLAHFGTITYNVIPQDTNLWTANPSDSYYYFDAERCNKDLDILDITYSIPNGMEDNFTSFLQFADPATRKVLRLYNASTEFESYIEVTITFAQPPALGEITLDSHGNPIKNHVITRHIPIYVKLDDYTTTEDLLRYIQEKIAKQLGQAQFSSPVSYYDLLSQSEEDYPTYIDLPAYYEATNTVIDEMGNPYTFTVAFHDIRYMIPNEVAGISPADSDGDYDIAKVGTLETEYTNETDAKNAVTLESFTGEIIGTTLTKSGITSYRLSINEDSLIQKDMILNLVASLDTEFDGKYNSLGAFVQATPQDRRLLQFEIPAVLSTKDFDDSILENGDDIYEIIDAETRAKNLVTAGRGYTFIRDLGVIDELVFDTPLTDKNLEPLKYFKDLVYLDISAKEDSGGIITNNDVTDVTVDIIGTLTKLAYLDMSYCDITSIRSLRTCEALEQLILKGNAGLADATSITTMAGNLAYLDVRDTSCDEEENEWAFAYCFYKYRDEWDGYRPIYFTENDADSEKVYDVPYSLTDSPEAYNIYRKLVYANAKFKEIDHATKLVGYVWLPKSMIEGVEIPKIGSFSGQEYYKSSIWASESAGVTVNHGSAEYVGNQIVTSSAPVGSIQKVSHSLSDTAMVYWYEDEEQEFIDPETQTTYSAIVPVLHSENRQIESKRFFFFEIQ